MGFHAFFMFCSSDRIFKVVCMQIGSGMIDMETRFVVVAGGVISGVGKGVATASIGKIMQEHGFKTTLIKIDPYINYDAGTLRPTEHGEVWVTADGGEIDQDLGTYERFINEDISKYNNITTGQIYHAVIDRERKGEYLGQTVQLIPHITNEIIDRIKRAARGYDIVIIEIGGTVGDYENTPFLFALKCLEREIGPSRMAYMLVTYLPVPSHIGEMKTKPTQQAIRLLSEQGIVPDFIICRSQYPLDAIRLEKIETFANIASDHIIAASDVTSVYQMPLELEKQQLGAKLLRHLQLKSHKRSDWLSWHQRVEYILHARKSVTIAIVGKYLDIGAYSLTDSYLSICHALIHAGAEIGVKVNIKWVDAKHCENQEMLVNMLQEVNGIIVPGGFGIDGVEGKMAAIHFARVQNIPYLGICYGMQLAAIEFARSVCAMRDANTTEVNAHTLHPIIDIIPLQKEIIKENRYGGTMRLGDYQATIKINTRIHTLYSNSNRVEGRLKGGMLLVSERHRHRYEVNPQYVDQLQKAGFIFSGYYEREDGSLLMEFAELPQHPFFIATQAHPEFKSRLGNPNPLFYGLVEAAQLHASNITHKEYVSSNINVQHQYQV